MNDLISREALLNEIMKIQNELKSDNDRIWERNRGYFKGLASANRIILDAPAVEPYISPEVLKQFAKYVAEYERPQGEWGKWIISEIRCPNCLEYFQTDCYSTEELKKCPNCGAKMKGGAE